MCMKNQKPNGIKQIHRNQISTSIAFGPIEINRCPSNCLLWSSQACIGNKAQQRGSTQKQHSPTTKPLYTLSIAIQNIAKIGFLQLWFSSWINVISDWWWRWRTQWHNVVVMDMVMMVSVALEGRGAKVLPWHRLRFPGPEVTHGDNSQPTLAPAGLENWDNSSCYITSTSAEVIRWQPP